MLRRLVAVLVFVCLGVGAYAAKIYWCSQQLDTPIFQEGDLDGEPVRLIAKLGEPKRTLHVRAASLLADDSMKDVFSPNDLAGLAEREVDVLVWEQTCLGSTIWLFAVAVDQQTGKISAVGGRTSYYSPVYYGG